MAIRLALASLVLAASQVSGQGLAEPPLRWGTASDSIHTLQAYAFQPIVGAGTFMTANGFGARSCSQGCILQTPAILASGESLRELELEACDTTSTAEVIATLVRSNALEAGFQLLGTVGTGSAATPGCNFFSVPVSHTVDNLSGTYIVEVVLTGNSLATRFQAVRLVYRLQVSPAPATATFADVPVGNPIHRFVEALVASGITAGCGGGNYCPDASLTRGQMAVFLATALGLHFPN